MKTARACTFALIATLTAAILATPQQRPPAQPTPAQLQQQIDDLKKRLDETQQTAATAKLANDYAQKTEDDAKSYYEKVLSTQTNIAWIVGISISVFIAIAGLLNFGAFQKLTNKSISDTAVKLRNEYSAALGTEIQKLKEANATSMQALSENLTTQMKTLDEQVSARTSYVIAMNAGFALAEPHPTEASIAMSRTAIEAYKDGKAHLIPQMGTTAIRQLLMFIKLHRPQDFPNAVRNELRSNLELFTGLDEELTKALLQHQALFPVLAEWREGKFKPTTTAAIGTPIVAPGQST
jgi:hypothetical protein